MHPDPRDELIEVVREALLLLRTLIDYCLALLDGPVERRGVEVEEIRID